VNFFGIGTLELLVILLVAFVALGPGKTVEVARTIGKMAREARRTLTEIMDAASLEERGERASDNAEHSSPASPPTEPVSEPSHLSAQSRQPSDLTESGSPDPRPPDSR
jgi:Sec-independent protein translocase protein TatA